MIWKRAFRLFKYRLGIDVNIYFELELGQRNPTKLFHFSRLGILEWTRGKKKKGGTVAGRGIHMRGIHRSLVGLISWSRAGTSDHDNS